MKSAFTLALVALAFARTASGFEMPRSFLSPHFADSPLAGTIWTGSGAALDGAAVDAAIGQAKIVMIGETHDNPDHHAIQGRIVSGMVDRGRRPAVVFEMIPRGMEAAIASALGKADVSAEALGDAVEWEKRGWPAASVYRPILDAVITHTLPVVPGDLSRTTVRAIAKKGAVVLPKDEAARFGLAREMPAAARATLMQELVASHCGMLPEAAVGPMLTVQRARDGALADAAATAAAEAGAAVLIAGSGHVRKDFAAPAVLAARGDAGGPVLSIGLMEVADGEDEVADYGITPATPAPYDIVMFTPKADVSDPCEGMAEAMGKRPAG